MNWVLPALTAGADASANAAKNATTPSAISIASSTTIRVIAGALAAGRERGKSIQELTGRLASISFDPSASMWTDVGFTSPGVATPSSRNQEMRAATMVLANELAPLP